MVLDVVGSNPTSRPKESIAYGNYWTNQTFALQNLDAMARIRKRLNKLHKINLIDCTLSVPYGGDIFTPLGIPRTAAAESPEWGWRSMLSSPTLGSMACSGCMIPDSHGVQKKGSGYLRVTSGPYGLSDIRDQQPDA